MSFLRHTAVPRGVGPVGARVILIMSPYALLAVITLAVGWGTTAAGSGERETRFRALDQGTSSGITGQREEVVRTREEWVRLWRAHQEGTIPPRPIPSVDFSREIVIAIFLGEQRTGGVTVRITRVVKGGDGLEVTYRVAFPPPGALTPQLLTFPFHIVAVPGHPGPVRFRRESEAGSRGGYGGKRLSTRL